MLNAWTKGGYLTRSAIIICRNVSNASQFFATSSDYPECNGYYTEDMVKKAKKKLHNEKQAEI